MPGGINRHCHIAGTKGNTARKIHPEEKRQAERFKRTKYTHSGTMGSVPSPFASAQKYLGMGYITAFDAAVPPPSGRHTYEYFDAIQFSDYPVSEHDLGESLAVPMRQWLLAPFQPSSYGWS